jgi:hypothetical protein
MCGNGPDSKYQQDDMTTSVKTAGDYPGVQNIHVQIQRKKLGNTKGFKDCWV